MKNIVLIAAVGKNYELGRNNKLIWHIPEDLTFFKEQTINKPIIMGKNTFDSLPKILPGRTHLVLTNKKLTSTDTVKYFNSKQSLLDYVDNIDTEIMVIGGEKIYKEFITDASKIILTEIDQASKADAYFPTFDKGIWERVELSTHEYKGIKYKHVLYNKIK